MNCLIWQPVPALVYITILVSQTNAGLNNEPITTYFGRHNNDGSFVDRVDPEFDYFVKKPLKEILLKEETESKLSVWPSVIANGGEVTVLWWNITNPGGNDFIAYYCPHDDNDPNHYIDLFRVSDVSKSWDKGYGHHSVNVYNMRTECAFKYFSSANSHLIAKSNLLKFENGPSMPLQKHIAATGNPTQMRISWNSGKVDSTLVVKYGLTKHLDLKENDVLIHYYEAKDMCTSPANTTGFWDPGYTYDVLLKNLQPNTRYYYAVGTEERLSDIESFVTPLPAGDDTPFTFIIYGDMGTEACPQGMGTAELVTAEINDSSVRFIMHHGDISYASGYAYTWDKWFDVIEPYASKVPYMVSIGNHEYDFITGGEKDPSRAKGEGGFRPSWWNGKDESGGECGVPMYKRFHMPDTGHSIWWYSFDYGLVHMAVISTEHDFRPDAPMYEWLKNDLASVDRSKTPWVIVSGHRAMYTSVHIDSDVRVSEYMQLYFEDLLKENQVDIAFWAHLHSTQRTCKVYKNECRKDGVVHIVVGSGGKSFDSTKFHKKSWSLFEMADWGYGRVSVANATHLHYEWVNNRRNRVLDDVWYVKGE